MTGTTNHTKAPLPIHARAHGTPRVSIGLPVYNSERYLRPAVESILNQTFSDFELIIRDNASTDGTPEIARELAARDARIRFIKVERNEGVAANFNRVFSLARAPYFRWHPADDLVAPEQLERCVQILDADPEIVLAYPRTTLIDEAGRETEDYDDGLHLDDPSASVRFKQYTKSVGLVNVHYGLMRSEVLRRSILLLDFVSADVVMLGELALRGRFHEIPDRLFFRRTHAQGSLAREGHDREQYYHGADYAAAPEKPPDYLRRWKYLGTSLWVAGRTPIPMTEKFRVSSFLLRRAIGERDLHAEELRDAVQYLLRRVGNRSGAPIADHSRQPRGKGVNIP